MWQPHRAVAGTDPGHDPVGQECREAPGEHVRFVVLVGEVATPLDDRGLAVLKITQQLVADVGGAHLSVAVGGGRVTIDRADVPLEVDQRVALRKVLGDRDRCVVDGAITVRVVATERIADDLHTLIVPAGCGRGVVFKGEQDPSLHRLEPIARIGDGALVTGDQELGVAVGGDIGDLDLRDLLGGGIGDCGGDRLVVNAQRALFFLFHVLPLRAHRRPRTIE